MSLNGIIIEKACKFRNKLTSFLGKAVHLYSTPSFIKNKLQTFRKFEKTGDPKLSKEANFENLKTDKEILDNYEQRTKIS